MGVCVLAIEGKLGLLREGVDCVGSVLIGARRGRA
jgi:hypothetical protein